LIPISWSQRSANKEALPSKTDIFRSPSTLNPQPSTRSHRMKSLKRVVIVGGGFAGLNAARGLRRISEVEVTLLDRRNHHLFQPLLYQVAMAGLSPADIAAPLRSLLSNQSNTRVLQAEVTGVDLEQQRVLSDCGEFPYDYLLLACGASHSYFDHDEWEQHAPGLKTIEQATEIRRRVLTAFEEAERIHDKQEQKRLLTFVVVGGGPTGVELAGAIGEMSRYTLAKDFRRIDATLARVFLIEAAPRILAAFPPKLANRAMRDLEDLGVQVWTSSIVTRIDEHGIEVGDERLRAGTVLWAAGVKASPLGARLGTETDRQGRLLVEPDLSLKGHSNVFVAGDLAHCGDGQGRPLPGLAPVAMQQGRYFARLVAGELAGRSRQPFRYVDKGQMATIGRSRAIANVRRMQLSGFMAWVAWLLVHIFYLTGFRNRLFVVLSWGWSYLSFRKGARLIVEKEWRSSPPPLPEPIRLSGENPREPARQP
jgi:NADH:ubiquinone reductase (H+-translocating)